MLQLRFVVLLGIMIASAIAVVFTRNLAIGALNSPAVQQYLKNSSKEMAKMIGQLSTNFTYYSFSQWFGKSYVQLVALFAILLSFSSFSKEFSKKTIYILSGRMTRWEIYLSKNLSGWLAFVVISVSGGIGYFIAAQAAGYPFSLSQTFVWTFTTTVGGLLLYQIGMYLSLLFKEQMKPLLLGIVVYVGLYITGLVKATDFLNVFGYMAQSGVLYGKGVNVLSTFVVIAIFFGIFIGGYFQFKYKDL
jgi:ABC-2 type transport system permease protein